MDRKLLRKISSSSDELYDKSCYPYVAYVYDIDSMLYNRGSWLRLWLGPYEGDEEGGNDISLSLSVYGDGYEIREYIDVAYRSDVLENHILYGYVGEEDGWLKYVYKNYNSDDFVYVPSECVIGEPDREHYSMSADVSSVICIYDVENGVYVPLSDKSYFVSGVRRRSFYVISKDLLVDESMNGQRIYCKSIEGMISSPYLRSVELNGCDLLSSFLFESNSHLSSVTICDCIKHLPNNTFSFCSKLEEVSLPKGLEEIGASCFEECISLSNIEIPSSVTTIGEFCFYGCPSLTDIVFKGNMSEIPSLSICPWGAENSSVIHCKDGDYVIEQ